ncbi:radical SAM family heme chaperone HemW [Aquabacterium sp. J223]|uniref:radical SAM family heme chaperone HemW n=1 Tax=Aquabacterium sp. J223 TaxID=2898431 RepID=UPI0021ADAF9B|nr:radical SAM family heme chaperone HemW [Aquabacterium sp. J223]UUX95267.1 radical SAM family heme chaperone HemW [Aquabacterium sp. J223]
MNDPRQTAAAAAVRFLRPGGVRLDALPPLSLYLHLPWCLRKCPYCDFNSHQLQGEGVPEARYLDALVADLESALPLVWGRTVSTVFIGGGTPSLFSPAAIDRLLADVRARMKLEPNAEVTLEANPGTFERERFRGYRQAGVTRLSIGVQSFDDAKLAVLGRVHDAEQAKAAVDEAASAFDTWNLDLMYALPGQGLADLATELDTALAFRPPHLSVYHLTLEPNTVFASRPPADLPDDDTASEMLDLIVERTAAAGLQRYEVSAFARDGHRCAHNLNYWRFGDYLGIGAGAHGKLSFPERIVRQVRWREPATYMDKALAGQAVSNEHEIGAADLPFEFMLNALRLKDGVDLSLFAERTGLPVTALQRGLAEGERRGLLERDLQRIRPTARGFDFLSDLQALFLPG